MGVCMWVVWVCVMWLYVLYGCKGSVCMGGGRVCIDGVVVWVLCVEKLVVVCVLWVCEFMGCVGIWVVWVYVCVCVWVIGVVC